MDQTFLNIREVPVGCGRREINSPPTTFRKYCFGSKGLTAQVGALFLISICTLISKEAVDKSIIDLLFLFFFGSSSVLNLILAMTVGVAAFRGPS